MDEPRFDFDAVFDDDYLYFYEPMLAERAEHEVEVVSRLLELEPGAEIADVPCGHGRIANALAERGFRVTGLDASELFLDRARRDADIRGVDVDYVHGDMRALPWRDRFDAVVNWFTSFGYFDDDGNRAVLASAHDALNRGGRFLVDIHNHDAFVARFQPHGVAERGDDFMIDLREFDVLSGRIETDRIVIRGGTARRSHFSIRHFTYVELRGWLREVGFREVAGYDSETGSSLTRESRRMAVVARK